MKVSIFFSLILILFSAMSATLFIMYEQHRLKLLGNLDPIGLRHYRTQNQNIGEENRKRIVFVGDSRVKNWRDIDLWGDYIEINRGVNGQTSAQVLHRLDYDVFPLRPDIVIVQVGINDLKTFMFSYGDKKMIVEQTKENLRKIVGRFKNTSAKLVLTTIIPPNEAQGAWRLFWEEEMYKVVNIVNLYIKDELSKECAVVDLVSLSNSEDKLKAKYSRDTLHLNEYGYGELGAIMLTALDL